jgi:hypothetical protein
LTGRLGEVVQARLPHLPWQDPAMSRMPGMRPVQGSWIVVDDAYAAQMEERARLYRGRRALVEAVLPGAEPAVEELRELVLRDLPEGFARRRGHVITPDERRVITEGPAFASLVHLVQEDLLLLERQGEEHVLIAGLLCFPANWTLPEKIGRPLGRIHAPVPDYDADVATRVQRLFDRVPPGRAMWRANALSYPHAILHSPLREADPPPDGPGRFVRSERQTILRLPRTGAVLFAVHTWIVPLAALTPAERVGCPVG